MSKKPDAPEVPEEFKNFVTETAVDGVITSRQGSVDARKDPDWPQFVDFDADDEELTADDVEEIEEDDDTDDVDDDEENSDADDEDNSDDDDSDDVDDDDDVDADDDDDADDDARKKEARKSKKRKSANARIAEITAARRQAEERAAALEAENEALKAGKTPEPKPEDPPEEIQPDLSDLVRPDPADDKYVFGEIDQQFLEDMAEYNAEKAFRKREAKAAAERKKAEATSAEAAAMERLEKNFVDNVVEPGKKEFDDFEDVVIEGGKAGNYRLTPTLVSLISESEAGAKIMYHFASNPEEGEKVAKMSVERQAAYFGRLEARFSSEKDAGKTRRAEPSKAPKPGKRRARGSGKGHRTNPATTDFSAFEKMANS
jgi:hypothetical protein